MKHLFLICQLSFIFVFNGIVRAQNCLDNSTHYIPLADLGNRQFRGYTGGKYPGGSNSIPLDHFNEGMKHAKEIMPLDTNGSPDSVAGKIGFIILGFSTAAMTGRTFISICNTQPHHEKLEFVIGAQGGRDINSMTDEQSSYWKNIDTALAEKNISANQIQVVWISTGDILSFRLDFPEQSEIQIEKYRAMLENIQTFFPNIKIVFISDRTYAGYIGGENGGPAELAEPTAYYNSWAVKWVIEKQIKDEPGYTLKDIPFIDWGPMLWTNGGSGNQSGYTWKCDDAGKGGIHPSSKGRMKEAALLYLFFSDHPYTQQFFTGKD